MKWKLMIATIILTVFACFAFVSANPVLCTQIPECNFSEGEVFTPSNGHYDFGTFALNSTNTEHFEVKHAESGYVLLVDETGDKVIDVYLEDKMISHKRDIIDSFLERELQKTSWMVDGVEVHEVKFLAQDNLYSACVKDISSGTLIFVATPSDQETADMINSLEFCE